MNVEFTADTKQTYLIPFSISEQEVKQTVTNEDGKKIANFGGYHEIIFVKQFEDGTVLVRGTWRQPNLRIDEAYKIFPHSLQNIDSKQALLVLQKFADDFGYTMQIGDRFTKFVFNDTFQIPKRTNPEEYVKYPASLIKFPEGEVKEFRRANMNVRYRQGFDSDYVDVQLTYVINREKYLEYLHENKPGSVKLSHRSD